MKNKILVMTDGTHISQDVDRNRDSFRFQTASSLEGNIFQWNEQIISEIWPKDNGKKEEAWIY